MENIEIRQAAAEAGVKLWRIADAMGIADHVFSRRLRHELPDADKERVMEIIRLLGGAENDAGSST